MPVPAHGRVQIGYSSCHPTLANVTQHSRSPPAVPTAEALAGVLPAALHHQTQHDPNNHALAGRADLRDGRHKLQARIR
jgi:hypothetical protein